VLVKEIILKKPPTIFQYITPKFGHLKVECALKKGVPIKKWKAKNTLA